jgi:hypothetical protein
MLDSFAGAGVAGAGKGPGEVEIDVEELFSTETLRVVGAMSWVQNSRHLFLINFYKIEIQVAAIRLAVRLERLQLSMAKGKVRPEIKLTKSVQLRNDARLLEAEENAKQRQYNGLGFYEMEELGKVKKERPGSARDDSLQRRTQRGDILLLSETGGENLRLNNIRQGLRVVRGPKWEGKSADRQKDIPVMYYPSVAEGGAPVDVSKVPLKKHPQYEQFFKMVGRGVSKKELETVLKNHNKVSTDCVLFFVAGCLRSNPYVLCAQDPCIAHLEWDKPLPGIPFNGIGTVLGWTDAENKQNGSVPSKLDEDTPISRLYVNVLWHHTKLIRTYKIDKTKDKKMHLAIAPRAWQVTPLPESNTTSPAKKPKKKPLPKITALTSKPGCFKIKEFTGKPFKAKPLKVWCEWCMVYGV